MEIERQATVRYNTNRLIQYGNPEDHIELSSYLEN